MNIISYYESGREDHWLSEIGRSDWDAAVFLHEMLRTGTFREFAGEKARVLLLTEGDELISFCTYAEMDDIKDTQLSPWMGFVFTFPAHRGHHYMELLCDEAARLAREDGVTEFYISTGHTGLYEKYGCTLKTILKNMNGEPCRVYAKRVDDCGAGCARGKEAAHETVQ